jgi:hypothetical protein
VADAKADYTSNCDLLLNSNFDSSTTGWLVADAEITNTGNVGAVIRVTATFKQAGSRPIRIVKKARVPIGAQKNVHFKRPVSQNETGAYQAAPGYFNGNACSVKAKITTTFGPPQ